MEGGENGEMDKGKGIAQPRYESKSSIYHIIVLTFWNVAAHSKRSFPAFVASKTFPL